MEKIINKILNIFIVLILISGLLSYQFILPTRLTRADEGIEEETVQEEAPEEEAPAEEPEETEEPEEVMETQQTSAPENSEESEEGENGAENTAGEPENPVLGGEPLAGDEIELPAGEVEDSVDGQVTMSVETENNSSEEVLPDAEIETGDASAEVSGVNAVNTNITAENGQQEIINLTGDTTGDVNLLETFETLLENAEPSEEDDSDEEENKTVVNVNTATDVENSAVASAETGGNSIESASGSATIQTGDADAAASIVNLINTNITGDNWLLAIINILGNWTGDLIVPGEGLLFTSDAGMNFGEVVNVNEAVNVSNTVSAEASTGGNSISNAPSASISTGDAEASASAMNLVNTNITKNNWFFLMINNSGSWIGKVMGWGADGSEQSIFEYNFGSLSEETGSTYDVYNYNSAANVSNTVLASAETGGNSIQNSGNASIVTGSANAWASAFNFVNTNITGSNWLFGVVNNAGNWNGNVVFGYPDLSVLLSADKEQAKPGETVTYTVNYKNIGKAKCDNVDLQFSLPRYLSYLSGSAGMTENGGNYSLSTAGMKPGEERTFSVTAKIAENAPANAGALEAAIGARTDTKEVELSNNYSSDEVTVYFAPVVVRDESAISKKESGLEMERKDDAPAHVNALSNHYIKVENSGKHTLYNIVVTEKIKNPNGDSVAEYNWTVAKLKKGQAAYIQYQLILDNQAVLGAYSFSAASVGYDQYGNKIKSDEAKTKIDLISAGAVISGTEESGEVLPVVSQSEKQQPIILGAVSEKKIAWQWLLLLLLIPAYYYIREKKLYRRENILRLSRQMGSLLSSFF